MNPAIENQRTTPRVARSGINQRRPRPEYLADTGTVADVAERFDVSINTVRRWLDEGLPSFKLGNRLLLHIPTVDRWIEAKLKGETFANPDEVA